MDPLSFNFSKCFAIVSKGKTKFHQCTAPKKLGEYCGKHANSKTLKTIFDYGASLPTINPIDVYIVEPIIERPISESEKIKNYLKENEFLSTDNDNDKKLYDLLISLNKIKSTILTRNNSLKSSINNESDYLTFNPINEISEKDLYIYRDSENFNWGFHIDSICELIKYSTCNPYNTKEIPKEIIDEITDFNSKKKQIAEIGKPINIKQDDFILPKTEWDYIKMDCIEIFQIMDNLDQYTKCDWFLNLQKDQLRTLYKNIEDIWNYRTGLTATEKNKYIKSGKLFATPYQTVKTLNRYTVMKLLLSDFRKLITEGETRGERVTGAMWILSALTLVSEDAREAFPWLYQSAYIAN